MNNKIKVKRVPKRGVYDKKTIYRILDDNFVCQISFIHQGYPVIIPTLYGRKGNVLYIHGASSSRMMTQLENGIDLCFSITKVHGMVLARSAFHHSLNYESVVLFGKATLVDKDDKMEVLKAVSDHMLKGRWEEVRAPYDKELKATMVLQIEINEASAKIRTGDPVDDKADYDLDIWAGVLPIHHTIGKPIPDSKLKEGIELAESVKRVES